MYISASTLDDLLRRVYEKLIRSGNRVKASRGDTAEAMGVLLKLRNPRARLSRTETKGTVFSCIGEFLWYFSKGNNVAFISYYISQYKKESKDGRTIYEGYGPRLFSMRGIDQVGNILDLLRRKPSSRRAVIQLFNAEDVLYEGGIPCTCTMQFMIRKNKLHMLVNMRSNDAFLGLPHDVFAFTMIQEVIARELGLELGTYKQFIGSLHLYENAFSKVHKFMGEGWQSSVQMPPMPRKKPLNSIKILLQAESAIRKNQRLQNNYTTLNDYWADIGRLLQIYTLRKAEKHNEVKKLKAKMSSDVYDFYIRKSKKSKPTIKVPEQIPMQF